MRMLTDVLDECCANLQAERDLTDRLQARITELERLHAERPREWQPIETAPIYKPMLVCWVGKGWAPTVLLKHANGTFYNEDSVDYKPPTHWQPIPAPPDSHVESPHNVIAQVVAERTRQDAKWGGPDHDDTHTLFEWWGFIKDRMVGRAYLGGSQRERQDLIEIAALAVAAVESFDRRQSWKPAPPASASGEAKERS